MKRKLNYYLIFRVGIMIALVFLGIGTGFAEEAVVDENNPGCLKTGPGGKIVGCYLLVVSIFVLSDIDFLTAPDIEFYDYE